MMAPLILATFVNRSNCYKKVGRYAAACADLRLALQIDPKHKQAKKSLAELELAMAISMSMAEAEAEERRRSEAANLPRGSPTHLPGSQELRRKSEGPPAVGR